MTTLVRKTQQLFGSTATDIGQFGSGQLGTKVISTDPAVLQSLSAFAGGWLDSVMGANKFPPIEEMNCMDYLASYQLVYLFQEGIPEYDAGTTYSAHAIVKNPGTFQLYGSLLTNNLGNALSNATYWKLLIDLSLGAGDVYIGGTSTGSANAQAVATTNGGFTNAAGNIGTFKAGYSNTAAATLAYDSAAALPIKKRGVSGLVALAANDIVIGEEYMTQCDGTNHQLVSASGHSNPINVINEQVFTSSGTYTPTTGMVYCIIEAIGGGGGGASTTSTALATSGGGAGAYARQTFSAATIGGSQTVTIGAGGAGGAGGGNNNGSNGGTTSVGGLISANGGGGAVQNGFNGISGAGGTAGGATFASAGQPGNLGAGAGGWGGSFVGSGGAGGNSVLAGGGIGGPSSGGNGSAGSLGSGGGGAGPSGSNAGGAGGNGVVVITEYCSQ